MPDTLQFLTQHGYAVLFACVFAEQIGLPIPAIPILLAAGALAGAGEMHLGLALLLAIVTAVVTDWIWYVVGQRRGVKVLQLLCRISLEPDSCVRQTEGAFAKYGARSLLVAKFVPGFSTAAPPLAGVFRMRLSRFLVFDALGALLWAGSFLALGWMFSDELEKLAQSASRLGGWLLALIVAAFAGYVAYKYWQRQRFIRSLRIARITPDDVKRMIDGGENPVIIDLRHSIDFEADPEMIPSAARFTAEDLERTHEGIPRDRDIVLYCT